MTAKKKPEKKSQKKSPKDSLPNTGSKTPKQATPLEQVTEVPVIEENILSRTPPELKEIIPDLPEELQRQLEKLPKDKLKSIAVRQTVEQFSSPYPPPFILDGLEKHCPGATNRVLAIVENQQKQQSKLSDAQIRKIDTEASVLKLESKNSSWLTAAQIILSICGTLFIALLIFLVFGFSAYCAYNGKTGPAWAFGGGGSVIGGVILAFRGYLKIPATRGKKR